MSTVKVGARAVLCHTTRGFRRLTMRSDCDVTTSKAAGRSFPASDLVGSYQPLVKYMVNVTNTGAVDADDVVLGFMVPPGAGVGGVPLQTLFGFERVHVKAGQTVSVYIYPALTDFTQVAVDGTRSVLGGEYTFKFGVEEAGALGQGYTERKLTFA